eukprot:gene1010-1147_t
MPEEGIYSINITNGVASNTLSTLFKLPSFSKSIADQYVAQSIDLTSIHVIQRSFVNGTKDIRFMIYIQTLVHALSAANLDAMRAVASYMALLKRLQGDEQATSLSLLVCQLISEAFSSHVASIGDHLANLATTITEISQQSADHSEFDLAHDAATTTEPKSSHMHYTHAFSLAAHVLDKFRAADKNQEVGRLKDELHVAARRLLESSHIEVRQSLIILLLPSLVATATSDDMAALTDSLFAMIGKDANQSKSDAFKVLATLFTSFFTDVPAQDLRFSDRFWRALVTAFTDFDPLIRKRASFLLKRIIALSIARESTDDSASAPWTPLFSWSSATSSRLQMLWDKFFLINETLDDFSVHLISPVWREMSTLVSDPLMSFAWIEVLFKRVLRHENPAVIKLQTIDILNDASLIVHFPQDFVFGTFISAITNTILYRGVTEDRIHASIAFFYDTFYASLATDARAPFLARLLAAVSAAELYKEFTVATLSFISRATNASPTIFIDEAFTENLFQLLEFTRRMNTSQRVRIYKAIIRIVVAASDRDSLSFWSVCRLINAMPIHIHQITKYSTLIADWLASFPVATGAKSSWLLANMTERMATPVDADMLTDGDVFVRVKSDAFVLSRVATYLVGDEFRALIANLLTDITGHSPVSIQRMLLLSSIILNAISTSQQAIAKELVGESKQVIIDHLMGEISTRHTLLPNHVVKLEYGDALVAISSFVVDLIGQPQVDNYILSLIAHNAARHSAKTLVNQLDKIAFIQHLYGLFRTRSPIFSKAVLQSLVTLVMPITILRPIDQDEESSLTGKMWGYTLAYFVKIKWRLIRNLLSLLEEVQDGIQSLENHEDLIEMTIDAISGANMYSIKPTLNSAQILLPFAMDENGDYKADTIERMLDSAWASANDTHFASMTAFIQLAFCPALLSKVPSDADDESINHHHVLKKYYNLLVAMSDTMVGLMNLLVMKCSPVWKEVPEVALYYVKEIHASLVFGPLRKEDDWDQTNDKVPSFYDPNVGFSSYVFNMGIDSTFENELDEQKFGVGSIPLKDIFSRAVMATFIRNMGVLSTTSTNKSYQLFVNTLAFHLIHVNLTSESGKRVEHLINTAQHRRRIRLWQSLCLLSNYVVLDEGEEILNKVASDLIECLFIYNLPSTRRYINIFVINFVMRYQSVVKSHFIPLLDQINARGDVVTSVAVTSGSLLLYMNDIEQCNLIFNKILSLCSSNHLSVRNAAIGMVMRLIESKSLVNKLDASQLEFLKHFEWYVRENTQTSKALERHLAILSVGQEKDDLVNSCDFKNLFYDIPVLEKLASNEICAPGIFEFLIDDVLLKSPLTAQLRHHLFLKSKFPEQPVTVEADVVTSEDKDNDVDADEYIETLDVGQQQQQQTTGYQKKILPWTEVEEETRSTVMSRVRQNIIIVATFVDKIPNIAGLARTSEIFNVESLVVSKKKVINDPMFTQISVTAEKWVPMIEVEEPDLKQYLISKREEGYTLLGLEQTSTSAKLESFKFPAKAVLLLGKEKEGIPTEYINLLDQCIEIPQFGIIRSLNVHVSGSILMWEFTKQQINAGNDNKNKLHSFFVDLHEHLFLEEHKLTVPLEKEIAEIEQQLRRNMEHLESLNNIFGQVEADALSSQSLEAVKALIDKYPSFDELLLSDDISSQQQSQKRKSGDDNNVVVTPVIAPYVAYHQGKLYIVGGQNQDFDHLSTIRVYNLTTKKDLPLAKSDLRK